MADALRSSTRKDRRIPESVESTLQAMEMLESALGREVARLAGSSGTGFKRNGRPSVAGSPISWWRGRLLEWVILQGTREQHPAELLRALALVLRDFSDDRLRAYLECMATADYGR